MTLRTLGLVAPSGFMPDPAVVDRAASGFSSRGWRVEAGDSGFAREQRFAGSDELRLGDLMRFATDPAIDVVLSARGGYGLSRLLDRIDYAAIKARAPIVAGYSDFTAFSLAYLALARGVSFSGPSAGDFGATEPDAFTVGHFFGVIGARRYEIDVQLDGPAGEHTGRLWGGNLVMVAALLGTRFFPRVRSGIWSSRMSTSSVPRSSGCSTGCDAACCKSAGDRPGDFDPVTVAARQWLRPAAVVERLRDIAGVPSIPACLRPHRSQADAADRCACPLVVRRGGRATLELAGHPTLAASA